MRRLVIIPLVVIVLLSFMVFWMDRSSLGDRLSVSFIGILTGVAYQLVMSEQLPRISYVTLMHGFLSLSFLTMCATVVINLVVGTLDKRGQVALEDRIDRRCRWGFPLAYFGLLLVMRGGDPILLAMDLSAWGEHCMTSRRAELWCKSNCPNQPRRTRALGAIPDPPRAMLLVLVLVAVGWEAYAQDLGPRAYANTVGLNFLLAGYTLGVAWRPTRRSHCRTPTSTSIARSLRTPGPWMCGGGPGGSTWCSPTAGSRPCAGQPQEREVSGFFDPRLRFSVNFYGAPALTLKEFAGYKQDLILGASLQVSVPLGQYDADRLVNIGTNRWFSSRSSVSPKPGGR